MADTMMDRQGVIRGALAAGTPDTIPLQMLREEVAWRQAAQLIKADALDPKTASREDLLAAIEGRKLEPTPAPEPAAETTTTAKKKG